MKITVSVTQKDIDQGCASDAENCPIARAINRRLNPGFGAIVGGLGVNIYKTTHAAAFVFSEIFPDRALAFIAAFDHNRKVRPFRFVLDLPERVLA